MVKKSQVQNYTLPVDSSPLKMILLLLLLWSQHTRIVEWCYPLINLRFDKCTCWLIPCFKMLNE